MLINNVDHCTIGVLETGDDGKEDYKPIILWNIVNVNRYFYILSNAKCSFFNLFYIG